MNRVGETTLSAMYPTIASRTIRLRAAAIDVAGFVSGDVATALTTANHGAWVDRDSIE